MGTSTLRRLKPYLNHDESGNTIASTQMINSPAQVYNDTTTEIILSPEIEVSSGAVYNAFIDGCGGTMFQSETESNE